MLASRLIQNICTVFYGIKIPFLQLINKYTSLVFMEVVRTRVSFSDIGTMLKFRTLNCIKLFYNSISGQFNSFLYYATFSVSRSSFLDYFYFILAPKYCVTKVDMLIFKMSWISFLIFLSLYSVYFNFFPSKLRRILPCLYCVINCGLKLFSPLPAPILTCVVLGRVSVHL